jgi:exodeoxyribonuclease VII small subunit
MSSRKTSKGSFEDSLNRLEKIVESLERGQVPLDDALNLYEEGIQLSKACAEKLKAAEIRIKKLAKNADGQFELQDLE